MKKILKNNVFNLLNLILIELIFYVLNYNTYSIKTIISIILYTLFLSFIISFFTSIFSEKTNKIINLVISFIISFWFALEYTFNSFMKTYFSMSLFKLLDQAASFIGTTLSVIFSNTIYILIFFIPFILTILYTNRNNYNINKKNLLIYILLIPLSFSIYNMYLKNDKEDISRYDLYHNIDNLSLSIEKLGLLSSTYINTKNYILGNNEKVTKLDNNKKDISIKEKNILNLDLTNKNIPSNVKDYILNNKGTNKNEYTSYFENKNLIFIVAESYDEVAVSKELTPTLYKLTNNGFVFNNFYVPYYLSTIGGEFQSLTGLYPNANILSTWKQGTNSFPYGLSTSFKNKGYNTYAYHDHDGHFQNRYKYLKSLGFDNFKACNMDLEIDCDVFPESDIEMINKTYKDYINSDKPFMTYYMTVSGHLYYNFEDNNIAIKNKKYVENLPYTEKEKAYLASQIELDRALELLINKLKENNKLEDTVIVLLADHYPYGLTLDEINELSSYERDNLFEINHNSLVIYNSSINKKEINKVGMPIDVLPTIYNLYGINYDSRLYAGNDLLSDEEGLVILNNLSWITDKGKYDSINNTSTNNLSKEYINNINKKVQNKIIYSEEVLQKDGYKYIKEK